MDIKKASTRRLAIGFLSTKLLADGIIIMKLTSKSHQRQKAFY